MPLNNVHFIEDKQFNSTRKISFLYRSTFLRITFSLLLILFKSNISFAQCSECLTNLLPLSGANSGVAKYSLFPIPSGSFSCPSFLMALPENETYSFDEESAMEIVEEEVDYPEFPDIAKWMDELNLYSALYNNEALQNLNPEMQDFYDQQLNTPSFVITRTNDFIAKLVDTTLVQDSLSLENTLMDIANSNQELDGGDLVAQNEYWVNTMYIRWFRNSSDDFSETEQTMLYDLANSCPFVNGPAVYKARAIYASINPGYVFDDLDLCLAVGVYKQSTAPTYIQIDESKLEEINESNFLVYPNPASNQLNLRYHLNSLEIGQFELTDITGRLVFRTELDYKVEQLSFSVSHLPLGVYAYRFKIDNNTVQTGKITIQ